MHFSPLPYLDPGSGSFILQVAIASLLAIGLAFRSTWDKLKGLFGGKRTSDQDEQDDEQR